MSYILEALRKADQERSAGSVPDLEAVHETSSPTSGSSRWIWVLGVILAVNALVLAVLLYDRRDEPAPVVEVSPPPEKQAVREPPPPPPAEVLSRPAPRFQSQRQRRWRRHRLPVRRGLPRSLSLKCSRRQRRIRDPGCLTWRICHWNFAAVSICRGSMCMSMTAIRNAASC